MYHSTRGQKAVYPNTVRRVFAFPTILTRALELRARAILPFCHFVSCQTLDQGSGRCVWCWGGGVMWGYGRSGCEKGPSRDMVHLRITALFYLPHHCITALPHTPAFVRGRRAEGSKGQRGFTAPPPELIYSLIHSRAMIGTYVVWARDVGREREREDNKTMKTIGCSECSDEKKRNVDDVFPVVSRVFRYFDLMF